MNQRRSKHFIICLVLMLRMDTQAACSLFIVLDISVLVVVAKGDSLLSLMDCLMDGLQHLSKHFIRR